MNSENIENSMNLDNKENKKDDIFTLSLDLFHLKIKKKKIFSKDEEFKPHLIYGLRKKIARLKYIEHNKIKGL